MTWIIKHTVHYATNLYLMKNGRQCTVIHPLQCCRVVSDNLPYTQRKGTPQHPKFAKNWGKIETRNSVKPVKQTPKYMYVLGCLSFYPQFCFAFFSLFWPNFYKASQILKKILKKHCEPPRCLSKCAIHSHCASGGPQLMGKGFPSGALSTSAVTTSILELLSLCSPPIKRRMVARTLWKDFDRL